MSNITYVDKNDRLIGYGPRLEAISKGIIHRIVRIFIYNTRGELLIQKRSLNIDIPKRWDQSAAGHVDEGEDYVTAARRELQEEVGIADIRLKKITKFYAEEIDDSVLKKRFNVLYRATYDGPITFEPEEISEVKWVSPEELEKWMQNRPQDFTTGFLNSYKQSKLHI